MKTRTIASILLGLIALTPALSVAFPEVGGIATDCTVEALEGGAISLSDYSDQIIVLFCLAVSDSRCIKAAPAYEANVHQVYKDWGVTVLGVDVDQGDTSADLSAFRDEHGINFPLAMDSSGNCWSSYRGDEDGHLPVFYLIGRDRVIKAIELGYRTGREKEITSVIDELLFEERPTINLGLNRQPDGMTPYLPGDTMEVYASLENPGYNEYQVTAFIAAGLGDDLFFWPSYSTIPQGTSLTLPPGFSISDYQIDSIPLAEWVPKGIHNWYAVLVDDATGEWLRDVEMVSWPFGVHERPSGERIDLIPPDDLWDYVCSNIGHEGEPFGYTEETMEMCNYYGHEFRLHQVWDLWRNVNDITAFTGEVSDFLLANSDDPAACATYCFDLLAFEGQEESRAGKKPIGGKDSLPVVYEFKTIADETNWDTLPAEIQDFVGLIVEASTNAAPSVESAFDKPFLASSLGISEASLDNVDRADLYNLVSEPWWNYSNANAPGFDAMYHTDLPALGSATSAFLTGVASAIDSLREYLETNTIAPTSFDTIEFSVGDSEVLICGTGNQQVFDNYSLIIDLGGDDSYIGSHAIPRSFSDPIGAIIDISGNDRYSGGSGAFNLCCGLFGIGAIFDLSGSDEYSGGQSSIAAAWHGAGILVDYEGGDTYDTNSQFAYWSQGAARCGLGLLMDLEGNDSYDCLQYSQAFGGTLGIGAIVDVSGDDDYHAEGVYSDPFYTNVAFAQGAANGRRADSATGGDGRSLAGGIGIMVDGGEGNDDYWGPVYVQGCAYWWSLGIFEERGGNDTYRAWEYSMGAAPHMAIGCMVDLSGDDQYNSFDVDEQYRNMGHGRDGSIGICLDGAGNDEYLVNRFTGGSGDLGSIGYFWDRYGEDTYYASNRNSFGYGYDAQRDFMHTTGVFMDTQGLDTYIFENPDGSNPLCADSMEWRHQTGPILWGYGLDMDWYE